MDSDISRALSYEIRKEMADRYFGFRNLIEQEKQELKGKIQEQSLSIEQEICRDLVRIYILLSAPKLISQFFELSGLDEDIFYDPYILSSNTIKQRLFQELTIKGLTKKGRFKGLFLRTYDELAAHIQEYRLKFAHLLEEQETLVQEIELFYKKNDLKEMMTFLRGLDAVNMPGYDSLTAAVEPQAEDHLSKKMEITPPAPIETTLSIIPRIPPLNTIKRPLKELIQKAYSLNKENLPYA